MTFNAIRRFAIDILGQRDFPNWRATIFKPPLNHVRDIVVVQCDSKLGDAVYLAMIADALISSLGATVTAIVSEDIRAFWTDILGPRGVVSIPRRGAKPASLRLAHILSSIRSRKGSECLIALESGESVDAFLIARALQCKATIGCGKGHFRLFDYSIDDPFFRWDTKNVLHKVADTLKLFGVPFAPPMTMSCGRLPRRRPNNVFFNTYGATRDRSFTENQIVNMIRYVLHKYDQQISHLVVSVESAHLAVTLAPLLGQRAKVTFTPPVTYPELLAKLFEAHLIISPDSGIAHLKGPPDSRKLIFYADSHFNPIAWGVSGVVHQVIPETSLRPLCDIPSNEIEAALDILFLAPITPIDLLAAPTPSVQACQ